MERTLTDRCLYWVTVVRIWKQNHLESCRHQVLYCKRQGSTHDEELNEILFNSVLYLAFSCCELLQEAGEARLTLASSFCTFGGVLLKTKILLKLFDSRKILYFPVSCFARESCSRYFEAILKLFQSDF